VTDKIIKAINDKSPAGGALVDTINRQHNVNMSDVYDRDGFFSNLKHWAKLITGQIGTLAPMSMVIEQEYLTSEETGVAHAISVAKAASENKDNERLEAVAAQTKKQDTASIAKFMEKLTNRSTIDNALAAVLTPAAYSATVYWVTYLNSIPAFRRATVYDLIESTITRYPFARAVATDMAVVMLSSPLGVRGLTYTPLMLESHQQTKRNLQLLFAKSIQGSKGSWKMLYNS